MAGRRLDIKQRDTEDLRHAAHSVLCWFERVDFQPAGKSVKMKAAARSAVDQNGLFVESIPVFFC